MRRLAAILRRASAWLRREEYVRTLVTETTKQAFLDGHKEGSDTGFQMGYHNGYQVGCAHGELLGRQGLAHELQVAHGVDEGGERAMTRDEIATIKTRQLH